MANCGRWGSLRREEELEQSFVDSQGLRRAEEGNRKMNRSSPFVRRKHHPQREIHGVSGDQKVSGVVGIEEVDSTQLRSILCAAHAWEF